MPICGLRPCQSGRWNNTIWCSGNALQYHLVLRKCPAQRQRMKDVLVYPDRGTLRPEEQTFVQLLHKQAALTVK